MPRIAKFTKEDIVASCLDIIRSEGEDALTARSLGARLGCSSSPIFTVFTNMEEVLTYTRRAARKLFDDYVEDVTDYSPAFKEFGLRLFRFSREEHNLFHFLFLSKEASLDVIHPKALECLVQIRKDYDLTEEQSEMLYRQMFVFACGLAVLNKQHVEAFSDAVVSRMLSQQFAASLALVSYEKPVFNPVPCRK